MDAPPLIPDQPDDDAAFAEPLTLGEAEESDAAWRGYLAGDDPGESLAQVRRNLRGKQGVEAGTMRQPRS